MKLIVAAWFLRRETMISVSLGCFNANVISIDPGMSVACELNDSQSL